VETRERVAMASGVRDIEKVAPVGKIWPPHLAVRRQRVKCCRSRAETRERYSR
jgi:hypothetical protein